MTSMTGGYLICLGGDHRWVLSADPDLEGWLGKMARIMGLERTNDGEGSRRIFCTTMDLCNGNGAGCLVSPGWRTVHSDPLARIQRNPATGDYLFEIDNTRGKDTEYINMWNTLYAVCRPVVEGGGLLLHAGLVEVDGKGIVIAGASGQGKSTTCRRLSEYWPALSDDETLIVRDGEKGYRAHPLPTWSDCLWSRSENSWPLEHSAPLAALFFVEQSQTDKVVPMESKAESAISINRSASEPLLRYRRVLEGERRQRAAAAIFDNACAVAKAVPAYRLYITLTGKVREMIGETMGL